MLIVNLIQINRPIIEIDRPPITLKLITAISYGLLQIFVNHRSNRYGFLSTNLIQNERFYWIDN